jgi:hypothetical protein
MIPRRNMSKGFESLPVLLKGHFCIIVCMQKLHYPRLKDPAYRVPLLKICSVPRMCRRPRRRNSEFEYLREFNIEFEQNLGFESGVPMSRVHENTRGLKSCATVISMGPHHNFYFLKQLLLAPTGMPRKDI